MSDLRQLRALRAVAEAGSFSAAAEELDYTQPAISKAIAGLEAELGAALVDRQSRPARLTDAGAALARHADDIFASLAAARSEIEAIAQVDAGTVSVGTFASAGTTFVVDALCRFRRRHPKVRVSIAEGSVPSALVRRLRTGEFDFAVVFDYPDAGEDIGVGLEVHHLLDVPFDVALPPDHRLVAKRRVRATDLAEEEWLLPDFGPESPSLRLIGRMCSAAGFEPRVAFRVSNCQMTLAMVAAGEGITLLPRLMLKAHPADVVIRPLSGEIPRERVAAVRLPSRYLTPATSEFLTVLDQAAESCDGSGLRPGGLPCPVP
jgi:DNA-binding transcriptional LysR family regulator